MVEKTISPSSIANPFSAIQARLDMWGHWPTFRVLKYVFGCSQSSHTPNIKDLLDGPKYGSTSLVRYQFYHVWARLKGQMGCGTGKGRSFLIQMILDTSSEVLRKKTQNGKRNSGNVYVYNIIYIYVYNKWFNQYSQSLAKQDGVETSWHCRPELRPGPLQAEGARSITQNPQGVVRGTKFGSGSPQKSNGTLV